MARKSKELVPMRGPELIHAIIRNLLPNLKLGLDSTINQLPLALLADKTQKGEGFVEIEIKEVE